MPEATIICCDCSEYMRNGDFMPTRFDSMNDAIGLISNAKTQQNHENTVGLIAMHANGKANVLVNCTQDIGRVLSSLSRMCIGGNRSHYRSQQITDSNNASSSAAAQDSESVNILVALQTAQLALKHRKNKKQDQRIILFIGSPIVKCQSEKQLIKAAKRLKKNNVAVDIVNFGEIEENTDMLQKFIEAVNSNKTSNLVTIQAGRLLSDVLISTPVFAQNATQINPYANLDGGANAAAAGGAGGANAPASASVLAMGDDPQLRQILQNNGIDPNTDPDIAMAIRQSLEEERQRLEADARRAQAASLADAPASAVPASASGAAAAAADADEDMDDEDEELLRALQMSMLVNDNSNQDDNEDTDVPNPSITNASASANANPSTVTEEEVDEELNNDEFMDALLEDLPGVDKEDLDMDELLANVEDEDDDEDEDNES